MSSAHASSVHGRFEPGTRLSKRYRIVGLLGRGGMGEVYRADDLELGQSVALKFLPERVAADPLALDRFRREVRTARQVAHPNVCRIYDIGEQDGHVFLSMEYVDGEDLAGVLRRLGRPSREKAIEIARQICLGLAAAHENKILHRDLKPANIMIDGRGRVRITDFGLSGFLDELADKDARAGTPAYMAPEQLAEGKVSVSSDIYALGLILYELFTGKGVFDTNDIEELKRKHASGTVSTPSSTTNEFDPAVERVIMRCLEAQPAQRPHSVYQILAALPSGDPLAAALAAGETPSPEMVANARDAGGLRPRVAVGLLLTMFGSIALTYFIATKTTAMPVQSPARLSVVAEQVMERLGYDDLPRYSVSGYDTNYGFFSTMTGSARSPSRITDSSWPPKYRYWRRWSAGGFLPSHSHVPEQYYMGGPTHTPGQSATVALDSTGRLLALCVTRGVVGSVSPATGDVDWRPVFELARLDPDHAEKVAAEVTPSVFCDEVVAWRTDMTDLGGEPVIALMGAVGGRPNYFEYVGASDGMLPNHSNIIMGGMMGGESIRVWCWRAFELLVVLLAVHNLLTGRADYHNALRCALLVGGLYALLEVLSIEVGGSSLPARVIGLFNGRAAGHILLHGLEAWFDYLAIEPFVRRVSPRMLIGLTRGFAGRWRDPVIGREVLIGLTSGCCLVALLTVVAAGEWWVRSGDPDHLAHAVSLRSILAPAQFLSNRAHIMAMAVLLGISHAGIVVLIRVWLRRTAVSACLAVAVLAYLDVWVYVLFGGPSVAAAIVCAMLGAVCLVWLYYRVGVLASMAYFLVVLSISLPGLAFDEWSTPYLVTYLVFLTALGAYAFWVSLAGQPIFKDMLEEPKAHESVR